MVGPDFKEIKNYSVGRDLCRTVSVSYTSVLMLDSQVGLHIQMYSQPRIKKKQEPQSHEASHSAPLHSKQIIRVTF